MWYLINVSSNLHTTDVKLSGLYFSGLFLDLFLNSGLMFASFHSEGIISSSSGKLNTFESGVLICSTFSGLIYTHINNWNWKSAFVLFSSGPTLSRTFFCLLLFAPYISIIIIYQFFSKILLDFLISVVAWLSPTASVCEQFF